MVGRVESEGRRMKGKGKGRVKRGRERGDKKGNRYTDG